MGLTELFLAIGLLALAVAGIAIKILVKPNGEFSGTCASNNPMLRNEDGDVLSVELARKMRVEQKSLPEPLGISNSTRRTSRKPTSPRS